VAEHRVSKADDFAVNVGTYRVLIQLWWAEASGPHLQSIRDNVTVEVRIHVGTAVVTPPTVGVQSCDGTGIVLCRRPIADRWKRLEPVARSWGHDALLIGPGIGTVPKPAAGPSKGQVPQVTLDEQITGYPGSNPSEIGAGSSTPPWRTSPSARV